MRPLQLYWRSRLVHINVNALIAGFLSILFSIQFVHLTRYLTDHPFAIALISYAIDGFIDFVIFTLLHALIYRARIRRFAHAQVIAGDIAVLQSHRITLCLVTFGISAGTHWLLMYLGLHRTPAFILAYTFGLIVIRFAHTWYGLRTGLFQPLRFSSKRKVTSLTPA